MYQPRRTESVLNRLAVIAGFTYLVLGLQFGLTGAAIGVLLAVVVGGTIRGDPQAFVGLGFVAGGVIGCCVGLFAAYMTVVWVEWAQQVLAALQAACEEVDGPRRLRRG